MKRRTSILIVLLTVSVACRAVAQDVKRAFDHALEQIALMDRECTDPNLLPTSLSPDGELQVASIRNWVSGFFPAALWYVYEYTSSPEVLEMARRRTAPLEGLRGYTRTHDLGFMVGCPVGAAYRLTGDKEYAQWIVDASDALISRFNPKVGLIRSWDNSNGYSNPYRVIIDNMMNLEMLFLATKITGDPKYRDIAVRHADTTMKNHFRGDGSAYHILEYDVITGRMIAPKGGQGFSDRSAWSRGQAWGLYGFAMCYRETGDAKYLDRARECAGYILAHLPKDMVPYWDYDAPDIPAEPRDASAAAITASALLELAGYLPDMERTYVKTARKILKALAGPEYTNPAGTAHGFILSHSVGSNPAGSQVDVPIIYADYYYLEALLRYDRYMKR